jgi:predicted aspartyl protease
MSARICAGILALVLASSAHANCKILQVAEWPVSYAYNRPLIQGKINGHPVKILIDTGSAVSSVWESAISGLGLQPEELPNPNVKLFGAGGEARVRLTPVNELEVGAFKARKLKLAVLGSGGSKHDEDMLLGNDFFSHMSTEFDIAHGVIRLLEPQGCAAEDLAYWSRAYNLAELLPTREEDPAIRVDVLMNGKHVSALLDSGAPVSSLDSASAERLGVKPAAGTKGPVGSATGVAEKSFETWLGTVQTVTIGDETIRNVHLEVADMFGKDKFKSTGSRIGQEVIEEKMLLGFDFLLSHRVVVVPELHAMVFTYNGGPLFQTVAPTPQETATQPPANVP